MTLHPWQPGHVGWERKHPVEWWLVEPGEGFGDFIRPRLEKNHTLFIAPKIYTRRLEDEWKGCKITHFTQQSVKKITPDLVSEVDQVLIMELGVNTRKFQNYPIVQSKSFYHLRKLLKDFTGPIIFRPRSTQERAFAVFSQAFNRAVIMVRMGYLAFPPTYDFKTFGHLNVDVQKARKEAEDMS